MAIFNGTMVIITLLAFLGDVYSLKTGESSQREFIHWGCFHLGFASLFLGNCLTDVGYPEYEDYLDGISGGLLIVSIYLALDLRIGKSKKWE